MDSGNVIVTQPQFSASQPPGHWQTGLMDCCSDGSVCLCGTFCYFCLATQVASDMNECCLCGDTVPMRTLYRTRYNIPGSIIGDFCTVLFCPACALCQLKRDINLRKEQRIF